MDEERRLRPVPPESAVRDVYTEPALAYLPAPLRLGVTPYRDGGVELSVPGYCRLMLTRQQAAGLGALLLAAAGADQVRERE